MEELIHVESERQRLHKRYLCPACPLFATCPQFTEQVDACADAEDALQEQEDAE